ncbi:hypothetical protein EXE45_14125 [Halorubrum sp. SP9]|nr:hypothetical protein EXE45_14125 [Halorubrum sp. SP9]
METVPDRDRARQSFIAEPRNASMSDESGDETPDDETKWRFSVDDVGPDGITEDTGTPESDPIEPGDVDLEHAVFVVLGVAATVGVLVLGL